jgi:hypothetical protein
MRLQALVEGLQGLVTSASSPIAVFRNCDVAGLRELVEHGPLGPAGIPWRTPGSRRLTQISNSSSIEGHFIRPEGLAKTSEFILGLFISVIFRRIDEDRAVGDGRSGVAQFPVERIGPS